MKQEVLLALVVLCACAAAMVVPGDKKSVTAKTENEKVVCWNRTPCAWTPYSPISKIESLKIPNTYCTCRSGTSCEIVEDDPGASTYVHYCRLPVEAKTLETS